MGSITEELARFLEGPNSITVAPQDGRLDPECTRALAFGTCRRTNGSSGRIAPGASTNPTRFRYPVPPLP